MTTLRRVFVFCWVAAAVAACDEMRVSTPSPRANDARSRDAAVVDSGDGADVPFGGEEAGFGDAGEVPDAGVLDAGDFDGGLPSAPDAVTDAGVPLDGGMMDAPALDTGVALDAGMDAGGCGGCASPPAAVCSGELVQTYAAQGTCVGRGTAAERCEYGLGAWRMCAVSEICSAGRCVPAPGGQYPDWLSLSNAYRAQAGAPSVTEDAALSSADVLHARYVVETDDYRHDEMTSGPWYTPAGRTAAMNSLGSAAMQPRDFRWAIDGWMQSPFHAAGLVSPRTLRQGYGEYHNPSSPRLTWSAYLDTLSAPAFTDARRFQTPVIWPGNGSVVWQNHHWGETPDPLLGCPGYMVPAGLPIFISLGIWSVTDPQVSAHSLRDDQGRDIERCVYDERTFTPIPSAAPALATQIRTLLDSVDQIIMIPREPLSPGRSYSVSITTAGTVRAWSFTVAPVVRPSYYWPPRL